MAAVALTALTSLPASAAKVETIVDGIKYQVDPASTSNPKTATITGWEGTIPETLTLGKITYEGATYIVTSIPQGNSISSPGVLAKAPIVNLVIENPGTNQGLSLGKYAFAGNSTLKSVKTTANISSLNYSFSSNSEGVFMNCAALESVEFTDANTNFKKIPNNFFTGCSALSDITLPQSIEYLGTDCLSNTAITAIEIPAGVASLSTGFKSCSNLKSVTFAPGTELTSIGSAFQNCPIESFTVPASVTSITSSIFYSNTALKSLIFEEGSKVTAIPESMCNGCTALATVVLPDGIVSIADNAFYNCKLITSINLGNALQSIGKYAFRQTGLTQITMPSSLKDIASSAFFYCTSLSSVSLNEGLTTIGASAFTNCSALKSIVIPSTVTSLGQNAFSNCTSLTSASFAEPCQLTTLETGIFSSAAITEFVIPNSVSILKTSKISDSRYTWALGKCQQLTSLTFPANPAFTEVPAGICNGDNPSSYGFGKLQTVILPDNITSIGDYAFSRNQIAKIDFPRNLTSIGNYSFAANPFTGLNFPETLESIGECAFGAQNGLDIAVTELIIPGKVTTIGKSAFSGHMPELTKIVIMDDPENPDLVRTYGQSVFSGDKYNLKTIEANPIIPPVMQDDAFNKNVYSATKADGNSILSVPGSSFEDYKTASGWQNFFAKNVTTGIEGVGEDGAEGVAEWYNLQGVRVARPEGGVFIRRQGDKCEKVLVK